MRLVILTIFVFLSYPAFAGSEYCFDDAAKRNGINKELLVAIAKVESNFNRYAVKKNRNGTEDVGLMQINSSHFAILQSVGIKRKDLFKPCVNIHVSALILKDCIRIHGNTWEAVGAYNAGNSRSVQKDYLRRRYAKKVWKEYIHLTGA